MTPTPVAGRIGITDVIADDDPVVAAEANRLERLRDPSHNRTLTRTEIGSLVAGHGAGITATARRDHPLDLEGWMSRTGIPSRYAGRYGSASVKSSPAASRPAFAPIAGRAGPSISPISG